MTFLGQRTHAFKILEDAAKLLFKLPVPSSRFCCLASTNSDLVLVLFFLAWQLRFIIFSPSQTHTHTRNAFNFTFKCQKMNTLCKVAKIVAENL